MLKRKYFRRNTFGVEYLLWHINLISFKKVTIFAA